MKMLSAAIDRSTRTVQTMIASVALAVAFGVSMLGMSVHAAEVTDQRGKTYNFAKPPQRAVFLPIPGPATYIAIDQTDQHIAAMNPYSASAMREGFLGKIYPRFSRIPTNVLSFGADPSNFSPNVEGILSARPDVLFHWATGADVINVLDQLGVPVLGMRASTMEDVAGYMTMMGALSGKQERLAMLLRRQGDDLRRVESMMSGLDDAQRPRVMYLNRAANVLRVSGRRTVQDSNIRLAGGRNVADSLVGAVGVTIEQILAWNPQVILLGTFDAARPSDLFDDPRWQSVAAVRDRRVYRMPIGGYRWDPPSQETSVSWFWLAQILQPDRSTGDLRAIMRDWFAFLYDHPLTEIEIDQILNVKDNGLSAGYDRLKVR